MKTRVDLEMDTNGLVDVVPESVRSFRSAEMLRKIERREKYEDMYEGIGADGYDEEEDQKRSPRRRNEEED